MDIKILEVSNISPPPGSVPTTSIPLTFFDLPWINVSRPVVVERLFFYDFSHPSIQNLLPLFKHTLSLTLQHFFPYAATLMCPSPPHKPYIRYTDDGSHSVPLTVAESSADFHRVVANYARDVTLLHPFVPLLAPARVESGGTRVSPLLALQITLFSGTGICIGATYNHAVADGNVFMKFINFWASLYRSGGGDFSSSSSSFDEKSLPCCSSRDVIKIQYGGLEPFFLNIYWSFLQSSDGLTGNANDDAGIKDKVRATFVIGRDHVERLKNFVSRKNRIDDPEQSHHVSTFVVTSAFMWVCLEKLRDFFSDDAEMFCYFGFAFDCRNIVVPGGPVNHFGNCLLPGVVKVKKIDLMGEDGIVVAARAIGSKVKEMKVGAIADAMKLWEQVVEIMGASRYVSVAGSPNLRVYDTDFGWGRPRKVEVTHIDKDGAMSLAESKDEKGGIEVGVALSKNEMDQLICIFEESLKKLL